MKPNGILSLGKETIVYGLGDAFYKAVAFFLIPVYLKYLSPDQYGTIESLMVTHGLAVTLVSMGLPNAVFRFYYRAKDIHEQRKIVSTIFFLNLILQISIPAIFWWKREFFATLILNTPGYGFYIAIISVTIFLTSFRNIPLYLLRAKHKPGLFTAVNLAVSIATLLLNLYFVVILKKGVAGVLLANMCGGAFGLVIIIPLLIKDIGMVFDISLIKKILKFSVPVGFSILPLTLIFMADRYFISHFQNLHSLGIYALGYKIGSILKTFIIMPFALAWTPFVFSKEKDEDAKEIFSRITTYYIMFGLICVTGISLLGVDIIKLLSKNNEYWKAYRVLPAICYSFFLYGLSQVIRIGCLITGKTIYITITMCIGLFCNLLLNYFLISPFGYTGSAYALLITFITINILSYIFSSRLYYIQYDFIKILKIAIFSILVIGMGMWSAVLSNIPGIILRLSLICIFVAYIFSNISIIEKQKLWSRIILPVENFKQRNRN